MGTLYYGDNLEILQRYLKDESIDLVYLDPPFNSAQNSNAFFHEKDGTDAASQIHAFEDTWHWDIETKKAYDADQGIGCFNTTRLLKSMLRCKTNALLTAASPRPRPKSQPPTSMLDGGLNISASHGLRLKHWRPLRRVCWRAASPSSDSERIP